MLASTSARRGCDPADANTKTVLNVQTSISEVAALQGVRAQPHSFHAAVIRDGEAGADDVTRVVPRRARLVRVGDAVAGYWLTPAKAHYRFSFRSRRVMEIDLLARLRYQEAPPPPEAARALAIAVAGHAEPNAASAWIELWCPTLDPDEQAQIVTDAAAKRTFWRADAIARLLDVTMNERTVLGLRTVGAIDCDKRQRTLARKQRDRDRKRAARAAASKRRPVSVAKIEPWTEAGLSRATWFRRKKRGSHDGNVAGDETAFVRNVFIRDIADRISLTRRATLRPASAAERVVAMLTANDASVAALIAQTGLPAATLRPILSRLVKRGLVVRPGRGVYRVAPPPASA